MRRLAGALVVVSLALVAPPASAERWPIHVRDVDARLGGGPQAWVTVVVFEDLTQPEPYVKAFDEVLRGARRRYGPKLRLVFKQAARTASARHRSVVALCAYQAGALEQGRALAFEALRHSRGDALAAWARRVIPDAARAEQLLACVAEERPGGQIDVDRNMARWMGLFGQLHVFVNGEPLEEWSGDALAAAIDRALQAATREAPSVPPAVWYDELVDKAPAPPATRPPAKTLVVRGDEPSLGEEGPLWVVFSDFRCPSCGKLQALYRRLAARGAARVVYKHLPLASHGRGAEIPAVAACAHEQGRFWAFAAQASSGRGELKGWIEAAELDAGALHLCLASGRGRAAVDRDRREAEGLGLTGTPTSFIGGERIVGLASPAKWKRALAEAARE